MKKTTLAAVVLTTLAAASAFAQPRPPQPPRPPEPPHFEGRGGPGPVHGAPGIPPQVAKALGISEDTQKKIRDLSFDANDSLIGLEAELRRKQLALERALAEAKVDERTVMAKLEDISKAELSVRKNRMGLMVKIRTLLGPDTWKQLEAEMPPFGPDRMFLSGPGGNRIRKEVRVFRGPDGREEVDVDVRHE